MGEESQRFNVAFMKRRYRGRQRGISALAKSMAAWLVPTVSSVAAEVTRSAIEMALAEVASKREAVLAKAAEEIAARHRAVKATAKRERMSKQKAAQQQAQQHAIAVPRMSRTFGGAPAGKRKRTAEARR